MSFEELARLLDEEIANFIKKHCVYEGPGYTKYIKPNKNVVDGGRSFISNEWGYSEGSAGYDDCTGGTFAMLSSMSSSIKTINNRKFLSIHNISIKTNPSFNLAKYSQNREFHFLLAKQEGDCFIGNFIDIDLTLSPNIILKVIQDKNSPLKIRVGLLRKKI